MKHMRRFNRAFTLIEVMVALAILSIALIGIYRTQTTSIRLFAYADHLTTATYLAAIKMNELDLTYKNKAIGEIPDSDKGDFKDLGYENYTWELTFSADPVLEKLSAAFAPKSDGQNSQLAQMASMAGIQPQVIGDTLSKSIKKLSLNVAWKEGFDDGDVTIWEHYLDNNPTFQCIPGLPTGPQPSGTGTGAPGAPPVPGQTPTGGPGSGLPVDNKNPPFPPPNGNTGIVPPPLPGGIE